MSTELKQLLQEYDAAFELRLKYMKLINEAEEADDDEKLAEYLEKYEEFRDKANELFAKYEKLFEQLTKKSAIKCPSCQGAMEKIDTKVLSLKDSESLPYRFLYKCTKCGEKEEINLLPLATSALT